MDRGMARFGAGGAKGTDAGVVGQAGLEKMQVGQLVQGDTEEGAGPKQATGLGRRCIGLADMDTVDTRGEGDPGTVVNSEDGTNVPAGCSNFAGERSPSCWG
jgi:hypothetical protein